MSADTAQEIRADKRKARRMRAAGYSDRAIARQLGVTASTLRSILGPRGSGRSGWRKAPVAAAATRGGLSLAEKRKLTYQDYEDVFAATGGDIGAVAEAFGVLRNTVRARLGLEREVRKSQMTVGEMRRRYESGETLQQVAEAGGVAMSTVHRTLRLAGVEIRDWNDGSCRQPLLRRHAHAVCVLYAQGAGTSLIAAEFRCHSETVSTLLRSHGVQLRSSGARVSRAERAQLSAACRDVLAGRLVVEAGELVPREVVL